MGLRGGRLPAARHLRLPLRDDQGAARRAGPVGGRPGLRGADGAGARGLAGRRGARRRRRQRDRLPAREGASLRPRGGLSQPLRGLRGHRVRRPSSAALEQRERAPAGQAGGEPVLPGGRRPGVGLGPRGDAVRARAGGRRVPARRRPGAGARARGGRDRTGRAGAGASSSGRPASPRCATTPPPTCCTPRCASGSAPTCARPARTWGRTSCASTSPTASGCRREELADIEERVNDWIAGAHGVRAIETTREEAEALGAMALFGEKYGDWVRMVEIEDVSRELCGGTHTADHGRGGAVPRRRRDDRARRTCAGSRR